MYDPTIVETRDLGSNFYLTQDHVGKTTRALGCVGQLKELNNYVKVDVAEGDLGDALFANYDVVLFTEVFTNMNDIIKWNEVMRGNGIGTIVSQTLGLYGYTFCDFGDKFMVHDGDGERTRNFIVILVEKMEDHIVITIHEDKRHTFGDNSYVNFREIQGSEELNSLEP